MISPLACIVCLVDPQMTTMIGPLASATVIVVPVLLRKNIADAIRGLRREGRDRAAVDAEPGEEAGRDRETAEDDGPDWAEPPGGVHP
jgi:hypothetical protein